MATSGKSSKSSKASTTGTGKAADSAAQKAAATGPVVLSAPVDAQGPAISRIPPSMPIESSLVGKADTPIAAASRRSDAAPAQMPAPKPTPSKAEQPAPQPAAKPAPTQQKPKPAAPVVVKKGGFWPMALGGVVAAALGAAAAVWALPQIMPDRAAPDLSGLREEAVTAATEAGASAGTQAAQQAIAALPPGDSTALQAELQAQAEKITALEAALAARPQPVPGQAASTAAPSADVTAQIEALTAQVAELSARPQLAPQAIEQVQALAQNADQVRADIEAAAAQARQSLEAVQTEADAATQRAQVVASVAALGAALEHGDTAGDAVQQLQATGVEVPEPLAQEDLPTLVQIQLGFDGVARTALRDSLKAESRDGGAMTAVGNFLRVQTGARSVEPREGADPDAVLSRAGALVQQGEIATALEELAALPPEGQQAMTNWMAQAKAYLAAESALNDVARTLN